MQDVVWTKDDSPYLVTGDVTISSGRRLTIMEGVKVIFLANSDSTEGGEQKYDSELLVEGSISVLGTEAEPVVFTSSEAAPSKGDWGGIKYKQAGVFEYAVLDYSGYGIDARFQNFNESQYKLEVKNTKIRHSGGYGIRVNGRSEAGNLTIEDTEFIGIAGSEGIAVYIQYGLHPVIRRCKFINNSSGGIRFQSFQGGIIEGNEFSNNGRVNIWFYYAEGDTTFKDNKLKNNKMGQILYHSPQRDNLSLLVEENIISESDNGEMEGIRIEHINVDVEILVKNNTVETRYDGIHIYGNYNLTPKITGNTIVGTRLESTGINIWGKIRPVIENNTIEKKQYGIRVSYDDLSGDGQAVIKGNVVKDNSGYGIRVEKYTKPVISLNDIENNGGYFVDNQTEYTVDARNNWWGETMKAIIESGDNPRALDKFYDQYDDSSKGIINYAGWLSATATDPDNPPTLADQMSGQLKLVDSEGNEAAAYELGSKVYLCLKTVSATPASPLRSRSVKLTYTLLPDSYAAASFPSLSTNFN
jgi:hypothetical protein